MEKDLVNRCRIWAKNNKWLVFKISDKTTIGIPDNYFLKDGRNIWIEFKSPTDKRKNNLQKWTVDQINLHGGEAYFGVNTFEKFIDIMRKD
jgi:hypothetical protein